jgi:hypothetical protein
MRRHLPSPGSISIFKIEQDANGRWQASAYLMPPLQMSYFPSIMVVAKNPEGWQIVSLKADTGFHDVPSTSPSIQTQ